MKANRGFTIVEVLVALLVLAIGLLAAFSTFASATRTFNDSHAFVEAAADAGAFLEEIRGAGCGGAFAGSWIGPSSSYTWAKEEISPQLWSVTVIVQSGAVRVRADTFSTTIPC